MGRLDLEALAEGIRQAIERLRIESGGRRIGVTVSIGLAVAGPDEAAEALCKRADVNLYRAKQAGRNRVAA